MTLRHFSLCLAALSGILAWAAPLAASDDWLALALPRPLAGRMELSLGLHQAQREQWIKDAGPFILLEADGQKAQRVISAELALRWQAVRSLSFSLALPGTLSELALWTGGLNPYPRLDDPGVKRNHGLGDLRVGLRQDWGGPQGAGAGWGLELVAPTGQGPLEAAHPLIATGEGRWQAGLRGVLGGTWGAWQVWAGAAARYQAGREAEVSPGVPLRYEEAGPVFVPLGAGGPLHLDPRWASQAALGLGWDWFRGEEARHSLALSLRVRHLAPLGLGGQAMDGTESVLVSLQPELQARFGSFNALAGWDAPPLYARHSLLPYWGELHFRLDHAF